MSGDSDWQKFLRTQSPWSFSSHHLYSAWFKSVGVLRNIRSPRDVALETEQAAEKQVGSQSPASEIRIAASSMMEHRQGHMILQGKTKSECLMNQPRTSTDTKTHPVTQKGRKFSVARHESIKTQKRLNHIFSADLNEAFNEHEDYGDWPWVPGTVYANITTGGSNQC